MQKIVKKKVRKNITLGYCHILCTFNNTIVTFTDVQGNSISWASAGQMGFKGSKKSTPYAAQITSGEAAKRATEHGLNSAHVFVKGPGAGRENAVRALAGQGVKILSVADSSPLPHNGCRAPKRRRV